MTAAQTRATTTRDTWLSLLSEEEEPLLRDAAAILGVRLTVVRTRQEFDRRLREHGAALVIGDDQPGPEQLSMIRHARREDDDRAIVAIVTHPDLTIEFLEAGADAIVRLDDSAERVAEKLRAARDGKALLEPEEQLGVLRRLWRISRLCVDEGVDVERCETLTEREREVVALLARRATNAQIAAELGIAEGTVKNHVHNALGKLDVESRSLAGVYWRVYTEKRGMKR